LRLAPMAQTQKRAASNSRSEMLRARITSFAACAYGANAKEGGKQFAKRNAESPDYQFCGLRLWRKRKRGRQWFIFGQSPEMN
jgi:hypothetical protein